MHLLLTIIINYFNIYSVLKYKIVSTISGFEKYYDSTASVVVMCKKK